MINEKYIINTSFGTNKSPVEVTKEGAFGGTYFRDIFSGINGNGTENDGNYLKRRVKEY